MIQAITLDQLRNAPIGLFKTGSFYMVVAYTEKYAKQHSVSPRYDFKDTMNKRMGAFKIVYESPAFSNAVHGREPVPYLKMYILEKV